MAEPKCKACHRRGRRGRHRRRRRRRCRRRRRRRRSVVETYDTTNLLAPRKFPLTYKTSLGRC